MPDEASPRTPLATFLLANCTFLSDAALLGLLTPSLSQNDPPPCPICFNPLISSEHRIIQINLPRCSHIFCSMCLSRHILAGYNTCPMCRTQWFHIPMRATTARTAANDLDARAWYFEARALHLTTFVNIVSDRIVRVLNTWQRRREDIAMPTIIMLSEIHRNFIAAFREGQSQNGPEYTLASIVSTQSSTEPESQDVEGSEGAGLLSEAQREIRERHQARVREMSRVRNESEVERESNASSSEATQSSNDAASQARQAIGVNSRIVLRSRDNMAAWRRQHGIRNIDRLLDLTQTEQNDGGESSHDEDSGSSTWVDRDMID